MDGALVWGESGHLRETHPVTAPSAISFRSSALHQRAHGVRYVP
jgi:hypothetical protein